MKFLKALLIVLGLVGVVAAIVYLFQAWTDIHSVVAVANQNLRADQNAMTSPFPKVAWTFGLAVLGGLLLGLGIALPALTAAAARREVLEDQRRSLDVQRAGVDDELRHGGQFHHERRHDEVPVEPAQTTRRAQETVVRPDDDRR